MLSTPNRLRSAEEFRTAVRRGRRCGGPVLVCHFRERTLAPALAPRVGFVVSRAVGPAVTRNLVKRRLRHLVRERLALLPDGSVLVVRALPAAAAASYVELRSELDRCFDRVVTR